MTTPAPQTSQLLADLALGGEGEGETFDFDELLTRFDRRAFGVVLLVVVLPVLLPIPFGIGALCGPVVSLVGLQLALRLSRPWLPRRLRQRPLARETFGRFLKRMKPWLQRLERLSRPRIDVLFAGTAGNVVSGLLLVILGFLLALPIPLTNYPFGFLILGFAFALIERDGALLLLVWAIALATIATFAGGAMELLGLLGPPTP